MKKYYLYLIGFLLFFCIFSFCKEGYINIYEPELLLKKKPSFIHSYKCKDDRLTSNYDGVIDSRVSFQKFPNSYYKMKKKYKKEGTYSSFLDVYDLIDKYYSDNLCDDNSEIENAYKTTDSSNQFRLIPGAFPEEDIKAIYKDELMKDSMDFKKPLNLFTNPEKLENYILYEEDIIENLLKMKKEKDIKYGDIHNL